MNATLATILGLILQGALWGIGAWLAYWIIVELPKGLLERRRKRKEAKY